MTIYRADKPNFQEFWVKMAKMTLKIKVNDLHSQYQPRVSQDACLVQIWWFQLTVVTNYRADKVKFTNRWTDGQTQATTIPLRPERPRANNKPVAKIPQCTRPICHNAPFGTEMCTFLLKKWCIAGYMYLSNALWDLWDGFIHHVDG